MQLSQAGVSTSASPVRFLRFPAFSSQKISEGKITSVMVGCKKNTLAGKFRLQGKEGALKLKKTTDNNIQREEKL